MNNRQNGRRRGRGGQQARNGQPGAPDRGSRLDNRARGDAAQLLEKYKTLARDSQMQGDRVNTEYYLQFADHYFRVLSETRSRFEEQRPRVRDEFGGEDDASDPARGYQGRDGDGDDWDDGDGEAPRFEAPRESPRVEAPRESARADASSEQPRGFRPRRQDRPPYQANGNGNGEGERNNGNANANVNGNAASAGAAGGTPRQGNGGGDGPASGFVDADTIPARIEVDRVPPSIAAESPAPLDSDDGEAAPKRRRTRRPRAESAPAEA